MNARGTLPEKRSGRGPYGWAICPKYIERVGAGTTEYPATSWTTRNSAVAAAAAATGYARAKGDDREHPDARHEGNVMRDRGAARHAVQAPAR